MSTMKWMKLVTGVIPMLGALGALGTGCATEAEPLDEHVGEADQALTAAQCNYFAVNGKVQICHRTASQSKPYTVLKISQQACVAAHALHAGDYVAVNDPNCQGGGCLPQGAPCDPTLPCCDGFSCTNGTCTPNVSDHCAPSPCQNGGACVNNPSGYTCNCPAGYVGTNCETEIDECASNPCVNGQCLDGINAYVCECSPGWTGTNCGTNIDDCANAPCQNAGTCVDGVNSYACQCAPGFAGTNCETNIDDCANAPCQNAGTCVDGVNSYACQCANGFTGTNCEQLTTGSCPCSGQPWWQFREPDLQCGRLNGNFIGEHTSLADGMIRVATKNYWVSDPEWMCGRITLSGMVTEAISGITEDEMQACATQIATACTCVHGTYVTNVQGGGSCVCDAPWTGTNCDSVDPATTCPCFVNSNDIVTTTGPDNCTYKDDGTNLYLNLREFDPGTASYMTNSANWDGNSGTCSAYGSGTVTGLSRIQFDACIDVLKGFDAAQNHACDWCFNNDCGSNECYGSQSPSYCSYY